MRPRAEWITHIDELLRIVSDDLWERAQRRSRPAPEDVRLKAGGKPKYLLSGLLRCGLCDAHYTITDAKSYGCSSYHDGHACSNAIRVRRDGSRLFYSDRSTRISAIQAALRAWWPKWRPTTWIACG